MISDKMIPRSLGCRRLERRLIHRTLSGCLRFPIRFKGLISRRPIQLPHPATSHHHHHLLFPQSLQEVHRSSNIPCAVLNNQRGYTSIMAGLPRPAPSKRASMRPPPRPNASSSASVRGRAPSPADSLTSSATSSTKTKSPGRPSTTGTKRKDRDFDQDGSVETNIHVVVRCRGRSDREVRENSGVVVSTNGVKGKNVELLMGPNALSNKTYHFDKVFSPAADQAMIFDDVVTPILGEV